MDLVNFAATDVEEALRLSFGGNEVLGAPSPVPVAPALRCTMLLSSLFFSVFLAVILLRMSRFVASVREVAAACIEARLVKATEALSLVPVIAILMIGTRLRAVQLAGNALGAPPIWAQLCMYGATLACFVRFIADVSSVRHSDSEVQDTITTAMIGVRHTATAFLFLCCGAIVLSTVTMQAQTGISEPLGPSMHCTLALVLSYLAESGIREIVAAPRKSRKMEDPPYGAVSPISSPDLEEDPLVLPTRTSLQFPPMLCVLLVAILLRAVQLQLETRPWAAFAMYTTTVATIAQAARSIYAAIHNQELPKTSLLGDEAAGPAFSPNGALDRQSLGVFWAATTCCIYVGTVVVLLSVAAMESKGPSPEVASSPPLSTAMKCVMTLTVVYYLAYLALVVGNFMRHTMGSWAVNSAGGVQRSLAFAPMLCVMMIGCRLRAMQIGVRDPPYWAQCSMMVATAAVLIQVKCSLVSESELITEKLNDRDVATKLAVLLILALRYVASAVLFLSVAALMVSVAWMQPVLAL
ncbi:hypothetical protein AK812_SmicGene12267 [Symbiodinium microadriaticum]|uniref:Uncharacterized protein n=1 Tax=Symbiodinium microadriaticum TaxID=2951 RepID=A0A1Q9EB30_SYMMI|nr:hypothetical protein AK812_SmicGene12267 [Symbiodinium microadriaticum]CAE7877726.1 unnamed protein product [Symbiodinium sp. KB8]